jgi:predicted nucleic acid-binding protein
MIHGLDTGFLVAAEVAEHPDHAGARRTMLTLHAAGDQVAIAPQVLAEFLHVATDSRRFAQPLDMNTATRIADQWWTAADVVQVFPNALSVNQFLIWLRQLSLGRKRLLDTLLAATYLQAGIRSLLTANATDFGVFGTFTCVTPGPTTPSHRIRRLRRARKRVRTSPITTRILDGLSVPTLNSVKNQRRWVDGTDGDVLGDQAVAYARRENPAVRLGLDAAHPLDL